MNKENLKHALTITWKFCVNKAEAAKKAREEKKAASAANDQSAPQNGGEAR